MLLDSARNLKALLSESLFAAIGDLASPVVRSMAIAAGPIEQSSPRAGIALGIMPQKKGSNFKLAVRCQRPELVQSKEVEQITKRAKGEVDVRFIGRIRKCAAPWNRVRVRPLQIGLSAGHFKITAGTLGAFVRLKSDPTKTCILSNNHVLADENRAKLGDAILQPGRLDGGKMPGDQVATLTKMIRLSKTKSNLVDAAIAAIEAKIKFDPTTIKGLGKLAGLGGPFVDEGTIVAKLGRTTGLTRGRVTAFELDNVVVGFDIGNLRFDNQIEIEGADTVAFSAGGDSGSIIVEESTQLAVALLFAGGDQGGTNGMGLTYANPIHTVLTALKAELVTA